MKHRDGIFASLALSVTLMAGLVGTGAYADAAGVEAAGYQALFHVVEGSRCDVTMVAANEVRP